MKEISPVWAMYDADLEEKARVACQRATYNAALTGFCAAPQSMRLQGPADRHAEAIIQANLQHGELKP